MMIHSFLGIGFAAPKPEKVCQWKDCPAASDPDHNMKVCARCTSVRYCSRTCQKADWPDHKIYCHIPPVLDIGAWMAGHYNLFQWALVEVLHLRTDPANILRGCLWVVMERMDRIQNGSVSPSPFHLNFISFRSSEDLKITGFSASGHASRSDKIKADGGIASFNTTR
ncbi:hypothetical protein B0H15DRAFT_816555 [Mycena belliarum]|uniref:MYND-type domain-containing protein n=1 Tax=Mycena belliarum TaxID=1033014 RepID=A0AAD6UK54_9AGAR|nr:hypothetical protein B0H15DRAFT_816555 [Mycena belliae]